MTERNYETARPIWEAMRQRYSCRNFSPEPIPQEVLDDLLRTGLAAASGGNLQPYSVVVIQDPARRETLCKICEDQTFMAQAPVNLVFLLDWYRYAVYARLMDAPFVADRVMTHFLIGLEDVMCVAQTVETAAFLAGIGSCYVGSVIGMGRKLQEFMDLPQGTFPVVALSLGYPAHPPAQRLQKLAPEMTVFQERYPSLTPEEIRAGYDEKFQGRMAPLPVKEPYRSRALETFRRALLTTYPQDRAEEILRAADAAGALNETQRRFGLHYDAQGMLEEGLRVWEDLDALGIHLQDR